MTRMIRRAFTALLVAASGVALATWIGASATAALIACLAGMAAFAFAPTHQEEAPALPGSRDGDSGLPAVADLLNAVETPLLIVRERRVLQANVAALELLGRHIVGSDVRLAIRHPAAAEQLGGSGEGFTEEGVELTGLGNAESHWMMNVTPLKPGGLLVRLTDQSSARALDQMRADFVANASHELRTPLATLLGFLETLEDDETAGEPATRKRFLQIMSEEAKRMRNLVEDLMSLSRIEADRFSAPRTAVDLIPLLGSVIDACRTLSGQKDSELVIDSSFDSALVPGDRGQLEQLFSNLVTNALYYGRAGTLVRIDVATAGELFRVTVTDQGEGIAPEHIPRLTERFYRVDAGRSRADGGTGLGLSIAKHIAQRHRGRLEIASELGRGTSVRVYLPSLD